MSEVVVVTLVVLLVWLATLLSAALLVARRVGRANRVSAAVPSPAPVRWHWTPSRPARLHRRLQVAVWPIDPARPHAEILPAVGTDALRTDLVAIALDTDRHLAIVRRAPARIRRAAWRDAAHRVLVIEDLAARLRDAPTPPARFRVVRSVPRGLEDLVERMQCLEHGRAEVARIEAWPLTPSWVGADGRDARLSSMPTPTR